jgi:D-amino-acid dehydrogenase
LRIAIIGAGIIGVTSAYELAADGHVVEVFERRQAVASESSFANAGLVSVGCVAPWATPWLNRVTLQALLRSPGWMTRHLMAARAEPARRHRQQLMRLAQYSRDRLEGLTQSHDLQFDQSRGILVLVRSARELARLRRRTALLAELGVAHDILDAAAAREAEPSIAAQAPLHAALRLPADLVGNCRQFAHAIDRKSVV